MPNPVLVAANVAIRSQIAMLHDTRETSRWTTAVMTALSSLRHSVATQFSVPPSALVAYHHDAPTGDGRGEFLLDFALSTYPEKYTLSSPLSTIVVPRILLAAESEWGKENSPQSTYTLVLDDFCKVVEVRAPLKVMVFGFHQHLRKRYFQDFHTILNSRAAELAGEEWLLFGVSWDGVSEEAMFAHEFFTAG